MESKETPTQVTLSAKSTLAAPKGEFNSADVIPAENLSGESLGAYQQAKVALGTDNVPAEGSYQEAVAMTKPPETSVDVPEVTAYGVTDKPLYGTRQRDYPVMHTYAVSVKDAYAPEHPAYNNPEARTQYFVTAPSQGQAIAQIKAIFPQYELFDARVI